MRWLVSELAVRPSTAVSDPLPALHSGCLRQRAASIAALIGALAFCTAATATEARDAYGDLQLRDCASAQAWLTGASDSPRQQDAATLLDLAIECAEQEQADTAAALLDASSQLAAPTLPEWQAHLQTRKARALLALGQRDAALGLADAASEQLLAQEGRFWDSRSAGITLYELAMLYEALAEEIQDSAQRTEVLDRALQMQAASDSPVSVDSPRIRDFRDLYGKLTLPNCSAAQRWLKARPDALRDSDGSALLEAARLCAKAGNGDTANVLLGVGDWLNPPADLASRAHGASVRASVQLELKDWQKASETLRASSTTLLESLTHSPAERDAALALLAGLASRNGTLAVALADTDPLLAMEHRLLAARLESLQGGSDEANTTHLYQALALAMKAQATDQSLAIAHQLLGKGIAAEHVLAPSITRSVGALLAQLSESGRREDVLSLARELKATNWPDASRIAEAMILHVERGGR